MGTTEWFLIGVIIGLIAATLWLLWSYHKTDFHR